MERRHLCWQRGGPPGFSLDRVLALLAPADQLSGRVQELPLPIASLTRVDGEVSSNLLARLVAIDYLHSESGLELGAMGAALAHWWEPLSGAFRGGTPQRVTMGPVHKTRPHHAIDFKCC